MPIFAATFMGFLCVAAICDLRELRIPNALTLAMALTAPPAIWLTGPGAGAIPSALVTGAVALACGWLLFELGLFGGGDAKLAAAAALWLGADGSVVFLLAMAVFGALLAAGLLVLRHWHAARGLVGARWRDRLGAETVPVPYALAMAPAGALALTTRLAGIA